MAADDWEEMEEYEYGFVESLEHAAEKLLPAWRWDVTVLEVNVDGDLLSRTQTDSSAVTGTTGSSVPCSRRTGGF